MMLLTNRGIVMFMLAGLIKHFEKGYIYTGQEKMLEILKKQYRYKIGRRMLNYVLRSLRSRGYIETVQRNKRNVDGTISPMTSLTKITYKGWQFFYRHAGTAKKLIKKAIRKIRSTDVQSKDDPGSQPLSREDQKEKARELAATLA